MTTKLGQTGATLVEIVVAMVIIGIVATGVMTAFAFGRQVTLRSHTELAASRLVDEIAETLRSAVSGPLPAGQPFAGLTLAPGIYVDEKMQNAPSGGGVTPTKLPALNFPTFPLDFTRFQTDAGTAPDFTRDPDTGRLRHGDGRLVVVEAPVDTNGNGRIDPPEEAAADLDGDTLTGVDLNNDGQADLVRVRVRAKFTSPSW